MCSNTVTLAVHVLAYYVGKASGKLGSGDLTKEYFGHERIFIRCNTGFLCICAAMG